MNRIGLRRHSQDPLSALRTMLCCYFELTPEDTAHLHQSHHDISGVTIPYCIMWWQRLCSWWVSQAVLLASLPQQFPGEAYDIFWCLTTLPVFPWKSVSECWMTYFWPVFSKCRSEIISPQPEIKLWWGLIAGKTCAYQTLCVMLCAPLKSFCLPHAYAQVFAASLVWLECSEQSARSRIDSWKPSKRGQEQIMIKHGRNSQSHPDRKAGPN